LFISPFPPSGLPFVRFDPKELHHPTDAFLSHVECQSDPSVSVAGVGC
jgi:hypothetical protein